MKEPAMENEKRSFLKRINPGNMKFTYKILVLFLTLVVVVIISYFTVGLKTLHQNLLSNTGLHLEELSYTKASEVEYSLQATLGMLEEIAKQDKLRRAGEDFITGFHGLPDDKFEFFYDDSTKNSNKSLLEKYYLTTIAENSPITGNNVLSYFPSEDKTLAVQYLYILQNPKAFGDKENYYNSNDNSGYSYSHASYHPYLLDLSIKLGADDLYLADPKTGHIVYSVEKNIDFGTNLFLGPFKNSKLSEAYRSAIASADQSIFISDFSKYAAASDKPAIFISIPIYFFGELTTVLILQYDEQLFDKVLFDENMVSGLSTLEYNVIGTDLILRNNPKDFLIKPEVFVKKMARRLKRNELSELFSNSRVGSMAMYLAYSVKYKSDLLDEGIISLEDYCGHEILASSKKLNIEGVDLYLISKIDRSEVLKPFKKQIRLYLGITLVVLLIVFFLGIAFGTSFSKRQQNLLDALNLLRDGEKSKKLVTGSEDELGSTIVAYNKLRDRIINAEEFALEMSEGNYNYEFEILSDRDSLGKSLNVLKDKLNKSKEEQEARNEEDEIQNWTNSGIAKFNDLLRENNDDIKLLAYSLIENLNEAVGASIGGIYLVEGENEEDKFIELIASYAYDRRKYHQKKLEAKEGLLGACYMEKKPIYLKQIPEDYIEIISGLGHQVPNFLYIVPLIVDSNVMGMIELASFTELAPHHIEFINTVADSIAATFISVLLNMKTSSLLEESRSRAEEIAQQEEEMRQNMEEMQATQEELARLRQEDEKRTREMQLIIDNIRTTQKHLLDEIPGGYILKDQNGVIHLVNAEGAKFYGLAADRILGKTDHELLAAKIYEKEHKYDLQVIDIGSKEYTEKIEIKGKEVEFKVIKKPFMMDEIGQNGVLTMRFKIS